MPNPKGTKAVNIAVEVHERLIAILNKKFPSERIGAYVNRMLARHIKEVESKNGDMNND